LSNVAVEGLGKESRLFAGSVSIKVATQALNLGRLGSLLR
jgi:hypothetical protein